MYPKTKPKRFREYVSSKKVARSQPKMGSSTRVVSKIESVPDTMSHGIHRGNRLPCTIMGRVWGVG